MIPETVVFKEGEPREWYFKSDKEGVILKKNWANVTKEEVVEKFLKKHTSIVGTNLKTTYKGDSLEIQHQHVSISEFRTLLMYSDKRDFQIF